MASSTTTRASTRSSGLRTRPEPPNPPDDVNILIVKPSSLGDIIHGLAVAQSIRDQIPEAIISWVVRDRFADIIKSCPTVVYRFAIRCQPNARLVLPPCRSCSAER